MNSNQFKQWSLLPSPFICVYVRPTGLNTITAGQQIRANLYNFDISVDHLLILANLYIYVWHCNRCCSLFISRGTRYMFFHDFSMHAFALTTAGWNNRAIHGLFPASKWKTISFLLAIKYIVSSFDKHFLPHLAFQLQQSWSIHKWFQRNANHISKLVVADTTCCQCAYHWCWLGEWLK